MKLYKTTIGIFVLTAAMGATNIAEIHAGGIQGGGGDIAVCFKSTTGANPFEGTYFLDELKALMAGKKLISPATLGQALDHVDKVTRVIKKWNLEFQQFRSALLKERVEFPRLDGSSSKNPRKVLSWIRSGKLENVPDEDLVRSLPKNCKETRQAIIRKGSSSFLKTVLRYHYDEAIVDPIVATQPLSASMGFTHEWLRDYIDDASDIRRINSLLHDSDALNMSEPDILQVLREHRFFEGMAKDWQSVGEVQARKSKLCSSPVDQVRTGNSNGTAFQYRVRGCVPPVFMLRNLTEVFRLKNEGGVVISNIKKNTSGLVFEDLLSFDYGLNSEKGKVSIETFDTDFVHQTGVAELVETNYELEIELLGSARILWPLRLGTGFVNIMYEQLSK